MAEIKLVIVTHVLAASYHACVSTFNAKENSELFFQTRLAPKRYLEFWSAPSGSSRGRQRVEALCERFSNKPVRGNELFTELEHDLAVVNRSIVYVPEKAIFSLDDDHQSLRSRAVTQVTNLAQVNNPKKALGLVNNAVCSALTSAFIASHYTPPGEKLIHIWERLVQLIQGAASPGSLTPMTDAVFAADRSYNSTETIQLINERLGATAIGTRKRSLDYPFVFGDGPISKTHKGMIVSEKGCRAVYSATKKAAASGKKVQALLYREGYSVTIAAMYHNDVENFGAHSYTLIPKNGYRELLSEEGIRQAQEVFCASDVNRGEGGRAPCRSDALCLRLNFTFALQNVQHFTLLQSGDPGWFLARSFQFTSRTTYSFLSSSCRNFDRNMSGLANNLRGRQLDYGAHRLPNDYTEVTTALCTKWDIVLDTIKMRKSNQQANNPRADALTQLRQSTSASLTVLRK